jgi:hypothetical protein
MIHRINLITKRKWQPHESNYLRLLNKRQVISVLKLPIKGSLLGVFLVILKADLSIQQGVLHLPLHSVIQEWGIFSLAF